MQSYGQPADHLGSQIADGLNFRATYVMQKDYLEFPS
jgi:hypothetical protein